jgi:tetratricopeptide (TPR) repeat protein
MWHSPLQRKAFTFIFLICLGGYAPIVNVPMANAMDTSAGPTSPEDAKLQWKDAETYYKSGKCEDALYSLKKLVDRYPGYPDAERYRLLRFQLGDCYFRLGKPAKALQTLNTYLEGPGDHPDADAALELIGKSQLSLKKYREAYLTAEELEKSAQAASKVKALVLKAQAEMKMNQDDRAEASAASAVTQAQALKNSALMGDASVTQLELKLRRCATHPPKGRLDEGQVRHEINARALCLNEALVQFRKVLGQESASSSDRAVALMRKGFQSFQKACLNPPMPPKLKPIDRTQAQLARYHSELKDSLEQIDASERKTALKLIEIWKQEKPSDFIQKRLGNVEDSLK